VKRTAGGRWARLLTEQRNPRSRDLDRLPTARVVALLLDEDRRALVAAGRARAALSRGARLIAHSLEHGRDVVFLGAGTSGRLGVLEAAECPPTFGSDPRRIRAVMAGGKESVFRSREGAEDRDDHGRREGGRLRRGDVLVGISASSVTPFVRAALRAARARRASTVLVTCAPSPGLRALADVVVAIRSGPEVLTGSTRLKAGSATKAALNALTTAAMVRLGKAYENLMVDLRPTSAKLVDRSRRIVAGAARVDPGTAARLLAEAGGDVKTAIVMGRLGVDAATARRRLRAARGHVRRALAQDRSLLRLIR
jgi:N-acetylmuramic acid 6-phosphate etherase